MSPVKKTQRKTSKKSAPKKPARAKPERRPAKPAAKKAAAKEPPKAKKAAAPAPVPKKAPAGGKDAARAAQAAPEVQKQVAKAGAKPGAKDAKKAARPRARAQVMPDIVKPGLGGRWECYSCGSKFYDLGRPEPTCPKCGADQRDKPREKPAAAAPQPERPRRAAVPMGSLLDEDEEPVEEFEGDDEDLGIEDDSFLTETPEAPEEDEDVDVGSLDED
jgi:hypothetical protein